MSTAGSSSRIFRLIIVVSRNALVDAGSKLGPALGNTGGRSAPRTCRVAGILRTAGCHQLTLVDSVAAVDAAFAQVQRVAIRLASEHGLRFYDLVLRGELLVDTSAANYFWFFLLTWLPTYLVK